MYVFSIKSRINGAFMVFVLLLGDTMCKVNYISVRFESN